MHDDRHPISPAKFKALLEKAGRIFVCSWAVGVVRDDQTGKSRPVVIFDDESGGTFTHAFSFDSMDAVADFLNRLSVSANVALKKNVVGGAG